MQSFVLLECGHLSFGALAFLLVTSNVGNFVVQVMASNLIVIMVRIVYVYVMTNNSLNLLFSLAI